jgi:hypothetical protein
MDVKETNKKHNLNENYYRVRYYQEIGYKFKDDIKKFKAEYRKWRRENEG